ncbi:MAG: class I SAM-dependent methyltransferase [Candidatus Bathyarchaeia archaeon]
MDDSCSQDEESFGFVKSRLYALTSRWRRRFIQFVADDIRSRNPRSVLDIGCGTGDILIQLRKLGIELYGIDPSSFMLELAEKKIRDSDPNHQLSTVHLSRGNNRHIPFDREFDIIFSSLSFHHWKNRDESIPDILARLSGHGEFVIYEYDRETMSFLRRLAMGKHALSAADVEGLRFDGYAGRVEHGGSVIVVSFKRIIAENLK